MIDRNEISFKQNLLAIKTGNILWIHPKYRAPAMIPALSVIDAIATSFIIQ
jgi:hypothetical protein